MEEAFRTILTFIGPFILGLLTVCGIKITNKYLDNTRREQYPEYFELFDTAIAITNEVHEVTEQKTEHFKFKYKLIYEGLREGESTVEYFEEYLAKANKEYIEFATWFEEQNKEAKRLFKEADAYARKHDLKWGILY